MIWRYTGTPCSGSICAGWQRLDNNQKTIDIAAAANRLYQLHNDGMIWRYTGTPCSGDSCGGWERLDNNPKTRAIQAGNYNLYQLHSDGGIFKYTGTPCDGASCAGWQRRGCCGAQPARTGDSQAVLPFVPEPACCEKHRWRCCHGRWGTGQELKTESWAAPGNSLPT